jgi:hypothetical protein
MSLHEKRRYGKQRSVTLDASFEPHDSEAQTVIDRNHDVLLGAEIAFRCLDGGMTQ